MSGNIMVACRPLGPYLDRVIDEMSKEIVLGASGVLSRGDSVGCKLALCEGL